MESFRLCAPTLHPHQTPKHPNTQTPLRFVFFRCLRFDPVSPPCTCNSTRHAFSKFYPKTSHKQTPQVSKVVQVQVQVQTSFVHKLLLNVPVVPDNKKGKDKALFSSVSCLSPPFQHILDASLLSCCLPIYCHNIIPVTAASVTQTHTHTHTFLLSDLSIQQSTHQLALRTCCDSRIVHDL